MKCLQVIRLSVAALLAVACSPSQDTVRESPEPTKIVELQIDEAQKALIQNLTLGSSRKEVIDALGPPSGKLRVGPVETLYYHGVAIELEQDEVIKIPDNFIAEWKAGFAERQKELAAMAAKQKQAEEAAASQGNQNIRKGGQSIDISPLVGNGSITIIDFYADWCGPCKSAEPHLKKLAKDSRVNLIQIDIVNWETPVVKQYGLRSIPNMRVFDANGKQIGDATHSVSQIKKLVEQAKKRS